MLSRTADNLFWLSRYMERAENMARLVDMGRRMSVIPGVRGEGGHRREWPAILSASGAASGFQEAREAGRYEGLSERAAAVRYLLVDIENPSSVRSCFEAARYNARSARGALTREMWEAINDAWIAFRALKPEDITNGSLSPLLDWIKLVGAQFRGASDGGSLRNDGFEFLRLGLKVERLDSMARLLDVKAQRLSAAESDGMVDRYEWTALLRAAGALLAYHAAYRADVEREQVCEFLIRNAVCPRSLIYCALRAQAHLDTLGALYGAPSPAMEVARALTAAIRRIDTERLAEVEQRAVLGEVIRLNNALSMSIAESYHFSPAAPEESAEAQALETEEAREAGEGPEAREEEAAASAAEAEAEADAPPARPARSAAGPALQAQEQMLLAAKAGAEQSQGSA